MATDECGIVIGCSTDNIDFAEGNNSAIDTLMDEPANALLGRVHIWFSLPVYFEKAFETATTINDSKCSTGAQNETIIALFYHIIHRVEGANTGNKGEGHRTLAVVQSMILEGLIQRLFVVLLYIREGLDDYTYSRDVQPGFRPFVICTLNRRCVTTCRLCCGHTTAELRYQRRLWD